MIKGTRLSVDFLLDSMVQGWLEEEIIRNYWLERDQVRACVAYTRARLSEEKVFSVAAWIVKLCANENLSEQTVLCLRRNGRDVLWICEAAPRSTYAAVLARAQADGRLLLTFDKDFGELVFRRGAMACFGIILFQILQPSAVAVADRIVQILASRTDWEGHYSVVEQSSVRMCPLRG